MIENICFANNLPATPSIATKTLTAGIAAVISIASVSTNGNQPIFPRTENTFYQQPYGISNSAFSLFSQNGVYVYYDVRSAVKEDLQNSLTRIESIALLEDNWNDNDAPRFSKELIERAKGVVYSLAHQPNIFPTANESIQLEFNNPSGDYLEIEMFEDGSVREFLYHPNGSYEEEMISADAIITLVEEFYGERI